MTAINSNIDIGLIENASIVFDTSALGKLYHLTEKNKQSMLNILQEHCKERIWIPSWVWREYQRNRKKLIAQPISDCYRKPKFLESKNHDYLHLLKDHINSLKSSDNFHPYFNTEYIEEMNELHKELQGIVDSIRCKTERVYAQKQEEIREITDSDDMVYDTLKEFSIANDLTYDKVMDIVREGDIRYRHSIPPGYLDSEKISIDKFGDLIIWKEIIEHSKNDKCDVVFICNDLKRDWYIDSNLCTPREELIYEFSSLTGNAIAIITLESFISSLSSIYSQDSDRLPLWSGIESIHQELLERKFAEQQEKVRKIVVECYDCNETVEYDFDELIDIEWHCEGVSYGKHGERISTYQVELWLDCPNCGSEHEIGVEVTIDESYGNEISCNSSQNCNVKKISQAVVDSISENKFEQCQRCGEWFHESEIGESGLCVDCEDYYFNMD